MLRCVASAILYSGSLLTPLGLGAETEGGRPQSCHRGPVNRIGVAVRAINQDAPDSHHQGAEHGSQALRQVNQAR